MGIIFFILFNSQKLLCSVDLLYAEIDNRVGKVNQDFDYIIRQSLSNGQLVQVLPKRDPVYTYFNKTDCDNDFYLNYLIAYKVYKNLTYYNILNYTLWYVVPSLSGGHTIFFEDTGKRASKQLSDDELEELFMESQSQFHLNLQGLYI